MGNLGEYLGAGSPTTKLLLHLNGNANDSSGNGNNGTPTNVSWVGGKIGSGSASYNGTTSGVNIGNVQIVGNPHTISTYIYPNLPASSTYDMIMTKWGVEGASTTGYYYGLYNNAGIIQIVKVHFNSGTFTQSDWNVSLLANTWYNIITTWDGTTNRLYINGVSQGDRTNSMGLSNFTHNTTIGISSDLTSHGFGGKIDEFIYENRAWTAEEIRKYYTFSQGKYIL